MTGRRPRRRGELVRRHGRADQNEDPERRDVEAVALGMAQQAVKRGRRQIHVGDPVRLDRLEHRAGIEAGQDHLGRADLQGRQRHRAGGVGQGRNDQVDRLVGPPADGIADRLDHRPPAEIGDVDALGRAGGAAGREDADDLVQIAERVAWVLPFRAVRVGDEIGHAGIAVIWSVEADEVPERRRAPSIRRRRRPCCYDRTASRSGHNSDRRHWRRSRCGC